MSADERDTPRTSRLENGQWIAHLLLLLLTAGLVTVSGAEGDGQPARTEMKIEQVSEAEDENGDGSSTGTAVTPDRPPATAVADDRPDPVESLTELGQRRARIQGLLRRLDERQEAADTSPPQRQKKQLQRAGRTDALRRTINSRRAVSRSPQKQ